MLILLITQMLNQEKTFESFLIKLIYSVLNNDLQVVIKDFKDEITELKIEMNQNNKNELKNLNINFLNEINKTNAKIDALTTKVVTSEGGGTNCCELSLLLFLLLLLLCTVR